MATFLNKAAGVFSLLLVYLAICWVIDITLTAEVLVAACFFISFFIAKKIDHFIKRKQSKRIIEDEAKSTYSWRFFTFCLSVSFLLFLNTMIGIGSYKTVATTVVDKDKSRAKNTYTYDILLEYKNERVDIGVDSDTWRQYNIGDCIKIDIQRGLLGFYVVKKKHFPKTLNAGAVSCQLSKLR